MINPHLTTYITTAKNQGLSESIITTNLLSTGWAKSDIDQALTSTVNIPIPVPTPNHNSNSDNNSLWDSFEHILMFISLYVLATSIALTLHLFIDKYLTATDASKNLFGYLNTSPFASQVLRGYLAAMIVSSPLFSYFFLKISARTQANPQLRKNQTRKKLIYFTLVVTFIFLITNIISIIFSLLNGNISLNAGLHFANTVTICGSIFAYYLSEVKLDRNHYD